MADKGRTAHELRGLTLAIRRQKRVVLLFGFAILLPAAILGFFGLRALEADRFRIDQLLRREQEEALRQAEAGARASITAFADALRRADAADDVPGILLRVTPAGDVHFVRERYSVRAREQSMASYTRSRAASVDVARSRRLSRQLGRPFEPRTRPQRLH